jgi:ABC-type phosphate/phosphonate transport system substrate-binding protein
MAANASATRTLKDSMTFRFALAAALALTLSAGSAAQDRELIFGVTEGVTYQATPKEIRDKFTPLAEYIGKATGRRVKVVLVPAYNDVRAGMAKQEYDLVFIHPAHVAMAEIKDGRYRAVAWTSGFTDYTVSLLMSANGSLKTLDDLRGHTLVTPDPDSITAMMVRAMLRTSKVPSTTLKPNPENAKVIAGSIRIITTRYQDAVPFYIENGFAQAGATAAKGVVKSWTDKGGKVLLQSRSVPIKQFLVSKTMPAEEQERVRTALLNIGQSKPGKEALDAVGYKGFVATNPEVEASTIAWLGL